MPGTADRRRAASVGRHADGLLEPRGAAHRQADRARALGVDAGAVPLPRRDVPPGVRGRRDAHALGRRARRRLAVAQHQPAEGVARLAAGDLLLEHGGHERLDHPAGPRDPQAGVAAGGVGQQRVARLEALGQVAPAEQVGQPGDELGRTGTPGLRAHLLQPALLEPVGDGPALEQAGAPDGAVLGDAVRRVTAAAAQRRQGAPDVHRHLRSPGGRGARSPGQSAPLVALPGVVHAEAGEPQRVDGRRRPPALRRPAGHDERGAALRAGVRPPLAAAPQPQEAGHEDGERARRGRSRRRAGRSRGAPGAVSRQTAGSHEWRRSGAGRAAGAPRARRRSARTTTTCCPTSAGGRARSSGSELGRGGALREPVCGRPAGLRPPAGHRPAGAAAHVPLVVDRRWDEYDHRAGCCGGTRPAGPSDGVVAVGAGAARRGARVVGAATRTAAGRRSRTERLRRCRARRGDLGRRDAVVFTSGGSCAAVCASAARSRRARTASWRSTA